MWIDGKVSKEFGAVLQYSLRDMKKIIKRNIQMGTRLSTQGIILNLPITCSNMYPQVDYAHIQCIQGGLRNLW